MFRLLVDTSVWLDVAKDPRQRAVVDVVEEMMGAHMITLIVPRIVLEEFQNNRERIAKESTKSLTSHVRLVKDAVEKVGGDKKQIRLVLSHLDNVGYKLPLVGGAAAATLDRIETILKRSEIIEATQEVTIRAAQRAIDKKAPFHRDKNSMADAVIIETYAKRLHNRDEPGTRFAFVTHNKHDFSVENGDQRLPHPDIAPFFSRIKSLYFINLPETLHRIHPWFVPDEMLESSMQEPRAFTELIEAEDLLFNQVWYNRHMNWRFQVQEGKIKIVEKETYPRPAGARDTIQRDIWKGALKAARKVEKRYGKKNLGPWSDFEWGMINGKLSALRWVLGDEWDMLDT
jgi:hypothetical protein